MTGQITFSHLDARWNKNAKSREIKCRHGVKQEKTHNLDFMVKVKGGGGWQLCGQGRWR